MANTTFSGPVRSENGFQVISKNATTGAITTVANTASTGIVTNKYVKHVGFANSGRHYCSGFGSIHLGRTYNLL